jgi:hypothetical protein
LSLAERAKAGFDSPTERIPFSSHALSHTPLSSAAMVKHYDEIPDFIVPWIKEQHLFWVATAPLSSEGHVNVSPKGIFDGNFNIVNSRRVWYEDMTGSGKPAGSEAPEDPD